MDNGAARIYVEDVEVRGNELPAKTLCPQKKIV